MKPLNFGNISEELAVRAIRTLRGISEEGDGGAVCANTSGGLASASDLGMLPKVGVPAIRKGRIKRYQRNDESVSDPLYMVSWTDAGIGDRSAGDIVKGQKKLQDGIFYVTFKKKEDAEKTHQELVNKGIDNVKLDTL